MENQPIDVVIAWVDGSDPKLTEKRNQFISKSTKSTPHGAKATRFASNNEIRYCVLSIMKFAPFVRNIYIVTDNQDPNLYTEVEKYFPHRLSSLKIVDHKEIFEGYEQYLPTFNSISIGNMVWRIKGLSPNFVYFNDDVILIREITPSDWVKNNRPVLRGYWTFPPYIKIQRYKLKTFIHRKLLGQPNFHPRFSFHIVQWNVAKMLGLRWRMFFNCHTPHVMNIPRIRSFFEQHNALLEKNIAFRFRVQSQFNITTLANHLELLDGNTQTEKLNLGYMVPSMYTRGRLHRKINACTTDTRIKSVCIQSLDTASHEYQNTIVSWLDKMLNLKPANQNKTS